MRLRVLLRASDLPDNTVVTKKTGVKRYRLQTVIRIYGAPKAGIKGQEIKAQEGARFLVAERDGSINAIPQTMELLAELDLPVSPEDF